MKYNIVNSCENFFTIINTFMEIGDRFVANDDITWASM